MQYYGLFYRPKLSPVLACINTYLLRWIRDKYRRFDATGAAHRKHAELAANQPRLFRHWAWATTAWR
jgi:RNA-directed DNA polymerase